MKRNVEAEPIFSRGTQKTWSASCPFCGEYWESSDLTQEDTVTCEVCGDFFILKYPDRGN